MILKYGSLNQSYLKGFEGKKKTKKDIIQNIKIKLLKPMWCDKMANDYSVIRNQGRSTKRQVINIKMLVSELRNSFRTNIQSLLRNSNQSARKIQIILILKSGKRHEHFSRETNGQKTLKNAQNH